MTEPPTPGPGESLPLEEPSETSLADELPDVATGGSLGDPLSDDPLSMDGGEAIQEELQAGVGIELDPERLDRLALENPWAPEVLRWRLLGLVDEVFWRVGEFDLATGRWVPRSLNAALGALAEALGARERIIPCDDLYQASRMAENALKRILDKPRQRIQRRHEMVPISSLRELDQTTMAWLAPRPGDSIRQKLAGCSTVLAPVRRFSTDSPENRMVAKLLKDLGRAVEVRLAAAEALGVDDEDKNRQFLLRLHRTCLVAGRSSAFDGLAAGPPPAPNNVMIADRAYSQAWRAWRLLRARRDRLQERWSELDAGLLNMMFWAVSAELCRVTGGVVAERLCKPDARGLTLLVAGDVGGRAGWTCPDSLTVCAPDDDRFGLWQVSLQDGTLRLRRTEPGVGDELVLAIAPSELGLRVHWALPELGSAGDWEAEPSWGTVREVVRGIVAHLVPEEARRVEMPPLARATEPVGLELGQGAIRAWHNQRVETLDLLTAAVRHQVPAEDGGNEVWLPAHCHQQPAPGLTGAAVVELWSALVGAEHQDAALRRHVCTTIAAGLSQVLQGEDRSQPVPVAFTVPDSASDFTLRDLRSAMRSQFSSALAVWRSVAIASAWMADGGKVAPGDVVVVVDGAGPTATATVLIARHNQALLQRQPESRGIYWERRYVLPDAWFDRCPGGSAVAGAVYGAGTKVSSQGALIEALTSSRSHFCLDPNWMRLPAEKSRFDANKALLQPLSELLRRVAEWRRDWREKGLGETTLLLSGYGTPDEAPKLKEPDGLKLVVSGVNAAVGCGVLAARRLAGLTTWVDWIPSLFIETLSQDGYFHDLELNASERIDLSVCPRVELEVKARMTLDPGVSEFYFNLAVGSLSRESLPYRVRIVSPAFPLARPEGISTRVTYDAGADQAFEFELKFDDANRLDKVTAVLVDVPNYDMASTIDLATPKSRPDQASRFLADFKNSFRLAKAPATSEPKMLLALERAADGARKAIRAQAGLARSIHDTVFASELGEDLFEAFVNPRASLRDPRFRGAGAEAVKIPNDGRPDSHRSDTVATVSGRLMFAIVNEMSRDNTKRIYKRLTGDIGGAKPRSGYVFSGQLFGTLYSKCGEEERQELEKLLQSMLEASDRAAKRGVVVFLTLALRRSEALRQALDDRLRARLARLLETQLAEVHEAVLSLAANSSPGQVQQLLDQYYGALTVILLCSDNHCSRTIVSFFQDRGLLARKARRIDGVLNKLGFVDKKAFSRIRLRSNKPESYRAVHDLTYMANLLLTGDQGLNLVRAELGED